MRLIAFLIVPLFALALAGQGKLNLGQPASGASNQAEVKDYVALQSLLKEKAPITWVITGDSVTEGAEWTAGERDYSQLFSERVRFEMNRGRDIVINTAISGNVADDILRDFDWRVAHLHPQVVSLMIGMNDCGRGPAGRLQFETNLNELINKIRAIGAIPIIQSTNSTLTDPSRRDLPAYNAIIQKVAGYKHTIFVDNWKYWHENRTDANLHEWLGNAIHPNGLGHAAIARAMFEAMGIAPGE